MSAVGATAAEIREKIAATSGKEQEEHQFQLGECYANGTGGVEKDEEKAIECYTKAAGDPLAFFNTGHPIAQLRLGNYYFKKVEVKKVLAERQKEKPDIVFITKNEENAEIAYQWFNLASINRIPEATFRQAQYRFDKWGLSPVTNPKNLAEDLIDALEAECRSAIEKGCEEAKPFLEVLLAIPRKNHVCNGKCEHTVAYCKMGSGEGEEKAEDYEKAAEGGDVKAQVKLGKIYYKACQVLQKQGLRVDAKNNADKAGQWFKTAALRYDADAEALFFYAQSIENEFGLSPDDSQKKIESLIWYYLASIRGHEEARGCLEKYMSQLSTESIVAHYTVAAQQGDDKAQLLLGRAYFEASKRHQDKGDLAVAKRYFDNAGLAFDKAGQSFSRAALRDDADAEALFFFALYIKDKFGLKEPNKDLEENAKGFLSLAKEKGHAGAQELLQKLELSAPHGRSCPCCKRKKSARAKAAVAASDAEAKQPSTEVAAVSAAAKLDGGKGEAKEKDSDSARSPESLRAFPFGLVSTAPKLDPTSPAVIVASSGNPGTFDSVKHNPGENIAPAYRY